MRVTSHDRTRLRGGSANPQALSHGA